MSESVEAYFVLLNKQRLNAIILATKSTITLNNEF